MKRLLALVLVITYLVLWVPAYAQVALHGQIDQLQIQLQQLTDVPADKPRRQLLQQTITALQSQLQLQSKIEALQAEIDSQPTTLKALNAALEQGYKAKLLPEPKLLDTEQLDQLITTLNARLLELERDQALQQKQQFQAEQSQRSIGEQLTGLKLNQEVGQQPDTTSGVADNTELNVQLQNARFAAGGLRVQALELELLAIPRRVEIAKLTWQQLESERQSHSENLEKLRDLKQTRQRTEAEQALSQLEETRQNVDAHPLLANTHEENQLFSVQLRELLPQIEAAHRRRVSLQKRLLTLSTTFRSIAQQLELEVSHISPAQRRYLFRNKEPTDSRKTANEINLLRLQNALIEQNLSDVTQQQAALPATVVADLSVSEQEQYRLLLSNRITLIYRLKEARQQLINELNLILSIENQINRQIEANSQRLSEQLLWNPVSNPIDEHWPKQVVAATGQLIERWSKRESEPLFQPRSSIYLQGMLLAVILLAVGWLRRYQRSHQQAWEQQIGHVIHDRFHHSVQLLFLTMTTALTIPLALAFIANNLLNPAHPDAETLKVMLLVAALATWTVHSLRNWLKGYGGLFVGHFGTSLELTRVLRRRLSTLYLTCLPLLLLQIYLWNMDSEDVRSGLTRLVMIALITIITLLWASLWKVNRELNQLTETMSWWTRAETWLSSLVLFNLVMLGLTVAGYTFTVNVMMYAVLQGLVVLLLVIVFYKLGMRWVLIAERRLEFERAKARRAEIIAAREKHEEELPLETNYLNLQTISDHSRTLLKTATLILLVSLLWGFLGGFLPFLGALDNVELWSSLNADSGVASSVTLKNILFGIVILSLSLLAAHNLPGLLELLVLQNLHLEPGTGYAFSSLIKYLLILLGMLGAFSQFGLEWGKLQWLVAALSVGLGFGLQEIVANFVSGLIILFEKPVRIGDTVTIDNLTGTVTRIQIRATTIVDWDRKEVIIPNKTFITQQLINWSLTDSVTRIVIPVGIAYGSDTELARQLLLDAAGEQSKVLKDPKPEAFFTGFGDSALNLELRLHVNTMADRLEVTHRVNTRIAANFRTAGLEMAFPQLDVHLQSEPDRRS